MCLPFFRLLVYREKCALMPPSHTMEASNDAKITPTKQIKSEQEDTSEGGGGAHVKHADTLDALLESEFNLATLRRHKRAIQESTTDLQMPEVVDDDSNVENINRHGHEWLFLVIKENHTDQWSFPFTDLYFGDDMSQTLKRLIDSVTIEYNPFILSLAPFTYQKRPYKTGPNGDIVGDKCTKGIAIIIQMKRAGGSDTLRKCNIVAPHLVALACDPTIQCVIFILVYIGVAVCYLATWSFDVYEAAKNGLVVVLFISDKSNRLGVICVYLGFFVLLFCAFCIYLKRAVACGKRLPVKLVKDTKLNGKVAVVTGGYGGIGFQVTKQLLLWKCRVIILGRSKTRAANAIEHLLPYTTTTMDLSFVEIDQSDPSSIRKSAPKIIQAAGGTIHYLINNAGVAGNVKVTCFKHEEMFATNHLGHAHLTHLLLPALKSPGTRIINVSSIAHYNYDPSEDVIFDTGKTLSLEAASHSTYYGRSKLFNIWYTHALTRHLKEMGSSATCFSCAPGIVSTPLFVDAFNSKFPSFALPLVMPFTKKTEDGAATILYLVAAPLQELIPGNYYNECALGFVSSFANDYRREEQLWDLTQTLIAQG
ncbi:bifunctional Short-chain dehydrogenase-reductase SDR/NAD(P)-binding domain superfamily [Babesia duncani]|uniref:Bifunctional Short-chain dehydrogenase-reductase SDR/NAD(P)-binding domain superfamily n=1 Tax=Babesia duncani TaxID=323732 RepID=A0AAD9PKU5_9APIC|nr:bifunctional Short-chain dehydrogenase-reductase SDR/NAD(P)-binding domain superfamily [Babesia duncani]